jgi:hypothetical protein
MQIHRIHVGKREGVKVFITIGCVTSSTMALIWPEMAPHATVMAVATNLVWVWA